MNNENDNSNNNNVTKREGGGRTGITMCGNWREVCADFP